MQKPLPEMPVMRLGLVGFSPAQHALFHAAMETLKTRLKWREAPLGHADAVCVNGSRATSLPDGSLLIASAAKGGSPVRIDPNESDRPLAFTTPLAVSTLPAASTFDMASPASTRAMLEKFEGWLRPVAVQFCLASRIVQERLDLSSTVYHVSVEGRLFAVVSRRTGVGVLPIADPLRVEGAIWARRPGPADEIPGHFVQVGITQVLWQYAMRTSRELLPATFRSGPIYWCRTPMLPQRFFRDSHLKIVRELAQAPLSFSELAERTQLPDAALARDLAALRLVGAVTQDRKQALRLSAQQAVTKHGKNGSATAQVATAGWGRARCPAVNDMTAPAPLMPEPL